MSELDLPAMLRAAARGEQQAWRALVSAYGRRVYGLLVRQCGDRDLAEELTQMTFVTLVEKLGRDGPGAYSEQGRFEPWLFRVATNKLRDEKRRRQRQARTVDLSPGAGREDTPGGPAGEDTVRPRPGTASFGGDPAQHADHAEQLDRLRTLVSQLPEQDRQVLELRHTAGLSFAQIAETLDQPLGTVLARAHRATAKLRKMMEAGTGG